MDENSSSGSKTTGIVVTIVVVIIGLVGAWYWFMYIPEQEAIEKARQEQRARQAAAARKKKREEEEAKKKVDYDRYIENGDREFEAESWEAAQSAYSEASSLFPEEQYPQDQLAFVNEKLAAIAARSVPGTIERITSATGRFYIIVSSSIDGDLAMDYANKMAEEGNSVRLIEPYDGQRFYRVSLGDYDTWDQATSSSTSFSTTDGDAPWILKY